MSRKIQIIHIILVFLNITYLIYIYEYIRPWSYNFSWLFSSTVSRIALARIICFILPEPELFRDSRPIYQIKKLVSSAHQTNAILSYQFKYISKTIINFFHLHKRFFFAMALLLKWLKSLLGLIRPVAWISVAAYPSVTSRVFSRMEDKIKPTKSIANGVIKMNKRQDFLKHWLN